MMSVSCCSSWPIEDVEEVSDLPTEGACRHSSSSMVNYYAEIEFDSVSMDSVNDPMGQKDVFRYSEL
jgi:hypothetical protein